MQLVKVKEEASTVILSVPNQVSNYVRQNSIGSKDTDYRVEPGNIPSDNTSVIADIAIIHISKGHNSCRGTVRG